MDQSKGLGAVGYKHRPATFSAALGPNVAKGFCAPKHAMEIFELSFASFLSEFSSCCKKCHFPKRRPTKLAKLLKLRKASRTTPRFPLLWILPCPCSLGVQFGFRPMAISWCLSCDLFPEFRKRPSCHGAFGTAAALGGSGPRDGSGGGIGWIKLFLAPNSKSTS